MPQSIAIMQPYFFPYIGYFQLIAAADIFVFHDDVQYIKQSWINRNRILRNGGAVYVTLPVRAGNTSMRICERTVADSTTNYPKVFAKICNAYRHAPFFRQCIGVLHPLFEWTGEETIAEFNIRSIRALVSHLGIPTPLITSSTRSYGNDVVGQNRVIRICQMEGAAHYINPMGAKAIGLYDDKSFAAADLTLTFLKASPYIHYDQGIDTFVPSLSIIDVLMFNSRDRVQDMLQLYSLESG